MTNEEELLKLYREYLHADDQFSGPRWWYMVNEDALAAGGRNSAHPRNAGGRHDRHAGPPRVGAAAGRLLDDQRLDGDH